MPSYGVEIELHQIRRFGINNYPGLGGWYKGTDSSFENCVEYKFSGPISDINNAKNLISMLYNNLEFIKCNTSHKYAGIHVHICTPTIVRGWWSNQIDIESKNYHNLQYKVNKLLKLFRRNSRTSWCFDKLVSHRKYSPVNLSSDYKTIEFRFFNSCHNKRYVCKCLDWATDLWQYMIMVYNANNLGSEVIFT